MEYGIVYLLTNPVMSGLVKIGMTTPHIAKNIYFNGKISIKGTNDE
jgi:hypothetical protein